MAKVLLAVFLIAFSCKLTTNASGFSADPQACKQVAWLEEAEKTGKEKVESGHPDHYTAFYLYRLLRLTASQQLSLRSAYAFFAKPSSGFTNPIFTPPNLL